MATYTEVSFRNHFRQPVSGLQFAFRSPSRTYANGDIVKYLKLERDTKIVEAIVGNEELDTNATPTATGTLRLNDGTTQVNLVTVAAATLGIVNGFTRLNVDDGLGYITPNNNFWLEFIFTAAFATAGAGVLTAALFTSPIMFGVESPLAPTG